jgi:chromosome segregation ATPase
MTDPDPGPLERLAHLTVPRLGLVDARRLAVRWARRHDLIYAELAREARRAEAAEARVRELEARCLDLRSLADQHAHESGLYARRMAQAQSARDEAKARVRELEEAIAAHRAAILVIGEDPDPLCWDQKLWAVLGEEDSDERDRR